LVARPLADYGLDRPVPFMDGAGPVDRGAEADAVERDVPEVALVDVPGEERLAIALVGRGVELAGARPDAVAGAGVVSLDVPARPSIRHESASSDRVNDCRPYDTGRQESSGAGRGTIKPCRSQPA